MIVKYEDYKKYKGESTIQYGEVVDEEQKQQPAPPKK